MNRYLLMRGTIYFGETALGYLRDGVDLEAPRRVGLHDVANRRAAIYEWLDAQGFSYYFEVETGPKPVNSDDDDDEIFCVTLCLPNDDEAMFFRFAHNAKPLPKNYMTVHYYGLREYFI